jgi:four helix bundle protein
MANPTTPAPVPTPAPARAPARARNQSNKSPIRTKSAPKFDHERLEVSQLALDFVTVAEEITNNIPKGRNYLVDQLRRAATSVVLNTAEGAGEFSPTEKARFYRMARRSATECAAVLDVCLSIGVEQEELLDQGKGMLVRIVGMMTRMVKSCEMRVREEREEYVLNHEFESGKRTGRRTGRHRYSCSECSN